MRLKLASDFCLASVCGSWDPSFFSDAKTIKGLGTTGLMRRILASDRCLASVCRCRNSSSLSNIKAPRIGVS